MRRPLASVCTMTLLLCSFGCRSTSCEQVEQELRAREVDVRQLREELGRTCAYTQALEQELRCQRGLGPNEAPLMGTPIRSLELGRGTGAYNEGGLEGDEGIQVLLAPMDPDGHAVKVPGSASILLYEVSEEGLKILLSTWEIPPERLRESWRSGLLSTGYSLILPWKSLPFSEKLRVVARFRLADGRVFEADKDISIRVPPARRRRMPPADAAPVAPISEPPVAVTPPPVQDVVPPPPTPVPDETPSTPSPEELPLPMEGPELPFPRKLDTTPTASQGAIPFSPSPSLIPTGAERNKEADKPASFLPAADLLPPSR